MHIKEMAIGMIFLVVMVTVSLFACLFIREILRVIVKKVNNNSLPKEESVYYTIENIIAITILFLILLLVGPYVVGIMENLLK